MWGNDLIRLGQSSDLVCVGGEMTSVLDWYSHLTWSVLVRK